VSAATPGYEVWRAAVPDFVCNVPGGEWEELPETIRAGFDAIAARETHAAAELGEHGHAEWPHWAEGESYAFKAGMRVRTALCPVPLHHGDHFQVRAPGWTCGLALAATLVNAGVIPAPDDPPPQPAPELDDTRKRAEAAERELAQLADSLGASVRAAKDAERKRIRELADRTGAVCAGDEGTSFYFSALLADKPEEVPGA
jgi:hypothetical protein